MGGAIARLATRTPGMAFAGGLGRAPRTDEDILVMEDAGALLRRADVVIDVSSPDFLDALLSRYPSAAGGPSLIVGTTGLGPDTDEALDALAARTAVLIAPNFALGVNLLLELVRRAAAALGADAFDVEIVEAHHRRKADAPSGTALALGQAAAEGRGVAFEAVRRDGRSGRAGPRPAGEIGMHAVRGGDVVGEHRVLFLGERERLELVHAATDRDVFAEGALAAARWIAGRAPGRYSMADVLLRGGSD